MCLALIPSVLDPEVEQCYHDVGSVHAGERRVARHDVGIEHTDGVRLVFFGNRQTIERLGVVEESDIDALDVYDHRLLPLAERPVGAHVLQPGRFELV